MGDEQASENGNFVFGENMAERVTKSEAEAVTPVLGPVKGAGGSGGVVEKGTPEISGVDDPAIIAAGEVERAEVDGLDTSDTTQMSSEEIFGHSIPKPPPEMRLPPRPLGGGAVPSKPFGGAGVLAPPVTNPFATSTTGTAKPVSASATPCVVSSTTNGEIGEDKSEGLPDSSTDATSSKPVLHPPTLQISNPGLANEKSSPPAEKSNDPASLSRHRVPTTTATTSAVPSLAPSKLSFSSSRSSPSGLSSFPPKASSAASNPVGHRSVAAPKLSSLKPSLLRPSALDAHTANWGSSSTIFNNDKKTGTSTSNVFGLQPAVFSASQIPFAPFGKLSGDSSDIGVKGTNGDAKSDTSDSTNIFTSILKQQRQESKSSTSSFSSSSSPFIFGTNLQNRVSGGSDQDAEENPGAGGGDSAVFKDAVSSSGDAASGSKTLSQAAAEFQASSRLGSKASEPYVEVKTGEEDESNVLQITCKLFLFETTTSTWVERGRGFLRLNDMPQTDGSFKSRLVMRAQGSLRLVLNTQLWAGMTVVRANPKSIRLTCLDEDGKPKIYLIQAALKDTEALMRATEYRIQQRRRFEERLRPNEDDDPEDETRRPKKRAHPSSTRESPPSSSVAEDDDTWDDEVTSTSKTVHPKERRVLDGDATVTPEKGASRRRCLDGETIPGRDSNDSSSSDLSPGSSSTKSPLTDASQPLPSKRRRSEIQMATREAGGTPMDSGRIVGHLQRSPDSDFPGTSASSAAPGGGGEGRYSSASTSDSHHESGTSTPPDPETEASNESYTSSITTHSLSE